MSLINSLENRFGRHGIPGLVAILAWFQVAVWVLIKIRPEFEAMLILHPALVYQGEIWRLVTWAFLPATDVAIFLLFVVMLMMTFSATLDQAWGPFKVNLYVFGGMFFMILGGMVFDSPPMGLTLYSSIFLAFAVIAPNYELMLFFILPVKVKWLAAIDAGLLLLTFIDTPAARLPIVFAHMNFIIAFGPAFIYWLKHRGTVIERRARFESAKAPEGTWLHKCHSCGKTELDDPKLDFRVGADDEDYCNLCRAKKAS